jgi:hypothetical protein
MSHRLLLVFACALSVSACSDDTVPVPVDHKVAVPDRSVDQKVAVPDRSVDQKVADRGLPDKATPDRSLVDYRPIFDGTPPECPQHTAIAPNAPCTCFGVFVYNVAVQFPDCQAPMEMHCCPNTSSPNCEMPGED